jgi:alanine racemase
MIDRIFNIFKKEYKTLNRIEILKDNLLHNYKYLSSLEKKVKVAPVLKSNGYGHGIVNVANILQTQNPQFFCVDSLYEAYKLLNAKIKIPILITGYTNPQNLKVKKLPFSYSLYTLDLAEVINKYQPQAGVHIFIDTGMKREGVTIEELPNFLESLKQFTNLKIEGVMSHLASTKGSDDKIFQTQISNFKRCLKILDEYKIKPKWIHIAASGGLTNPQTRKIISQVSNLSRAGLALYGLEEDKNLKPSLRFVTSITQIKTLKKGEKVGYDGTFTAQKDMLVGILPLGYNDGIDRRLSNLGYVTIEGYFCKILGRVSMNITTIDLTNIKNPKVGQEVLVYSQKKEDKNSIYQASKICNTIPYDLLIHLAESTRRIIV